MNKIVLLTTTIVLMLSAHNASAQQLAQEEVRADFEKYFDQLDVVGTFVLYNQQENAYVYYNKDMAAKGFIPASTFKIYNSLIGLEEGVIKDKHHVIPWDGVRRTREVINKDQDLESAYKNSALWYYQELARQVGYEKMKHYINQLSYGNMDISAGVDVFWIEGGMRISPIQQVKLLVKLRNNELPFSARSTDIVKELMVSKTNPSHTLRTKTGWGYQDGKDVGWYVGYMETDGNVFYFAICIQPKETVNSDFANARIQIVELIFDELGLIKE